MLQIKAKPGDTLAKIAKRYGITTTEIIKANPRLQNPDKIFVGQIINLPIIGRRPPIGTPQTNQPSQNIPEPAKDLRYVETSVKAVGLPIWGGPFYLYRSVTNGRGTNALVLARGDVSLDSDPLKPPVVELTTVYTSKPEAEAALASFKQTGGYSYYLVAGTILPTVVSDTTAPALCTALRQAISQERKDAKAAASLATDLLLWYVGARVPVGTAPQSPGVASPAVRAAAALAGFTESEVKIILEVRDILKSAEMLKLREAYAAGQEVTVTMGGSGRYIQFVPTDYFSGFTNFGENGFSIGRPAFSSEAELVKTCLHELYRLTKSVIRSEGVSAATAKAETDAAFAFAERAYAAVVAGL